MRVLPLAAKFAVPEKLLHEGTPFFDYICFGDIGVIFSEKIVMEFQCFQTIEIAKYRAYSATTVRCHLIRDSTWQRHHFWYCYGFSFCLAGFFAGSSQISLCRLSEYQRLVSNWSLTRAFTVNTTFSMESTFAWIPLNMSISSKTAGNLLHRIHQSSGWKRDIWAAGVLSSARSRMEFKPSLFSIHYFCYYKQPNLSIIRYDTLIDVLQAVIVIHLFYCALLDQSRSSQVRMLQVYSVGFSYLEEY